MVPPGRSRSRGRALVRPLTRVLETVLYADDLVAAEQFYGQVLGLPLDSRKDEAFAFFRVGESMLLLFRPAASLANAGVPRHGACGPGHVCFAVAEAELEAWAERLAAAGHPVEHRQDWPRGGWSFYVRDPAGNSVELATPRIWGLPEPVHDLSTGPTSHGDRLTEPSAQSASG